MQDPPKGFFENIRGICNCEKLINLTGYDIIDLQSDCINESIVNGIRDPILNSFAKDNSLGHEKIKIPRITHFKKINYSVWSHITFYLEDDDHNSVDFKVKNDKFYLSISENMKSNILAVLSKPRHD